jgi:hypothetical protein
MANKQFELQGKQGVDKGIATAIIVVCLAMVVFTIIAIQAF